MTTNEVIVVLNKSKFCVLFTFEKWNQFLTQIKWIQKRREKTRYTDASNMFTFVVFFTQGHISSFISRLSNRWFFSPIIIGVCKQCSIVVAAAIPTKHCFRKLLMIKLLFVNLIKRLIKITVYVKFVNSMCANQNDSHK